MARLGKYIKYGGYAGVGLGGASSYLKVQEVCRHGETQECKRIRLTEAGSFTGGVVGGSFAAAGMAYVAGPVCAVFTVASGGLGGAVCGIVLVGGAGFAGSKGGAEVGELGGEVIYEVTHD